jgi:hypothetical protein
MTSTGMPPEFNPEEKNNNRRREEVEREVEEQIERARSELTTVVMAKQKEVIRRMGEALEKIRDGEKRSSICEELKVRLREEIKRKLISEKTIEEHSDPEWKNPAKSKAGKKGAEAKNKAAESAEISAAESAQQDAILVRTDGSVEGESAGNNEGSRTPRGSEPVIQTEGSGEAGEEKPASDNGAAREQSPRAEPGDTLSNSIEEKEQKLAPLEHNDYLQAPRQAQHEDRDALGQLNVVDFEFYLLLRKVRTYMVSIFKTDGGDNAKVWFHGTIDPRTGSVVRASCGRKEAGDTEKHETQRRDDDSDRLHDGH